MPILYALIAGTLFGAGLAISDMVNPARVQNFLDLAGTFDPTLLFVMGGALAVALPGYRLVYRQGSPLAAERFHVPSIKDVDPMLVGGAAIFGVGWGLAGICPGPAFADLVTGNAGVVAFIVAMIGGMFAARWLTAAR